MSLSKLTRVGSNKDWEQIRRVPVPVPVPVPVRVQVGAVSSIRRQCCGVPLCTRNQIQSWFGILKENMIPRNPVLIPWWEWGYWIVEGALDLPS